MSGRDSFRLTPRLVFGLGVLLIGLLLTAESFDLLDADLVWDYWPLLIVAIGATKLGGRSTSDKLFAFIWIGIGLWILAWNLGYLDINPLEFFWPLVLIIFGLNLIFGGSGLVIGPIRLGKERASRTADGDSIVNMVAVLSGVQRRVSSANFEGGEITAFMGGGELDLSEARIAPGGEAVLNVFVMWGGFEMKVPADWDLSIEVLPLLGGIDDARKKIERTPDSPRLVLQGVALMGGVEVRN